MFNDYWGFYTSPSLEFINFLVEVSPKDSEGYPEPDYDFIDFMYGEGQ